MKISACIIFIFLSLASFAQFPYQSYPSYKTVYEKFYTEYSLPNDPDSVRIEFEKRPTGWHVAKFKYGTEKEIENEIFWDSTTKKYHVLNFPKLRYKDENKNYLLERAGNTHLNYHFNTAPYFGYTGWDWDVIQNYGNVEGLPDSILYGLGKAYSTYASNLLENNSGTSSKEHRFNLPEGQNCLSKEQLEKYRYYDHLAIKTYKKVMDLNPDYKTIVGSIRTKWANEYMNCFLNLRIFQNEEEAQKELADSIYTEFYICTAKNYLSSCAPNAILFTNGDNDTYPLLYVQAKYKFRQDVLLVNLSLLNTYRYYNHLKNNILEALPFPSTLSYEEAKEYHLSPFVITELENAKTIDINNVLPYIRDKKNKKEFSTATHFTLPSNSFSIPYKNTKMIWHFSESYAYTNMIYFMDMLAKNNWQRPIYFSSTVGTENLFDLENYMSMEGFAYRLCPTIQNTDIHNTGGVNIPLLKQNLLSKFEYKGFDQVKKADNNLFSAYKDQFINLADACDQNNQLKEVPAILEKLVTVIPNEIEPFGGEMLPAIELYYKLKNIKKANEIANTIIFNVKNDKMDTEGMSKKNITRYYMYILYRISTLARENDHISITENTDAYLESLRGTMNDE